VGRKVVKFRSVLVEETEGKGGKSLISVKDHFEEGFSDSVDTTAQAYNDLHSSLPTSLPAQTSTSSSSPLPLPPTTRPSGLFLICYHLPVKVERNEEGVWRCQWKNSLIAKTEGSVRWE